MAAYTPNATWVDGGAPGISAERLNHMETQYSAALTMALPLSGGTMTGNITMQLSAAVLFGGRFKCSYNTAADTLDIEVV